jgi:hypothetical protein
MTSTFGFRISSFGFSILCSLWLISSSSAWHIALRCTPDIAYARIQEPNTNRWQFEFSTDGGRSWTWCGNSVTGNVEAVFYKNPDHMLFRARQLTD